MITLRKILQKKTIIVASIVLCILFVSLFGFEPLTALAQTEQDTAAQHESDNALGWEMDALGEVLGFFTSIIFYFASWAVEISGWLLTEAIEHSIGNDGQNYYRLAGVLNGWEILRDLANMVFIFILLYIAFATILQISNFNTKRILITLIIIALLVNFSFFLTGIVIDVSNILALFLYNIITENGADIGEIFTALTQISESVEENSFSGLNSIERAIAWLMASLFFFVVAFVFLSGAITFSMRIVVLMLLLVVAPIAFVAAILPQTRKHWNQWLGMLINHAFIAPVYLLLISVILVMMGTTAQNNTNELLVATGAQDQTLAGALSARGASLEANIGIVLYFVLLLGLMLAVQIISGRMAGGISKLSVKWAGAGIGLAAGATALAGRQVIGRVGYGVSKSETLQKTAEREGVKGMAARLALRTGDRASRASYDVRGRESWVGKTIGATTGPAGSALGAAGIRVDAGRPGVKKDFATRREEAVKRAEKRAGVFTGAGETPEERVESAIRQREQYAKGQEKIAGIVPIPKIIRDRRALNITLHAGREKADKIRKGKSDDEKLYASLKKIIEENPDIAKSEGAGKSKSATPDSSST